jgi:hypothetical protein
MNQTRLTDQAFRANRICTVSGVTPELEATVDD